jgi:hypothetical protein
MGSRDLVRFGTRGVHRTVRRSRWRNSLIVLLILSGQVAEVSTDFRRQLVLDRARVRSLVGDADLHKVVKERLALDFELPSQIINSNLTTHLFIGLPAIKHVLSQPRAMRPRIPDPTRHPTGSTLTSLSTSPSNSERAVPQTTPSPNASAPAAAHHRFVSPSGAPSADSVVSASLVASAPGSTAVASATSPSTNLCSSPL